MAKTATPTKTIYYTGVGRRKTAVAQIRLQAGSGKFSRNTENVTPNPTWLKPLGLVGKDDSVDISIVVRGGGISSQDDAITLGITRALINMDETLKTTLRKANFVTVDARVKERKKPGLKRARKAPQWSKR